MAPKTEADHITLLLAIIAHSEAVKWNDVAETTGLYKSGKFVWAHSHKSWTALFLTNFSKQAYDSIKKKYAADAGALPTPKSTKAGGSPKKRRANAQDDEVAESTPSKKARSKKQPVEESEDEAIDIKEDSD